MQSLKETFADNLPGEIEKVKKLRKYARHANNTLTISPFANHANQHS